MDTISRLIERDLPKLDLCIRCLKNHVGIGEAWCWECQKENPTNFIEDDFHLTGEDGDKKLQITIPVAYAPTHAVQSLDAAGTVLSHVDVVGINEAEHVAYADTQCLTLAPNMLPPGTVSVRIVELETE